MKLPIPVLDPGHSGMINNKYPTNGKKFTFPDGTTIHEGEFNRAILSRVIEGLYNLGIPYFVLVPEYENISLSERVKRADKIYLDNDRNTFLVSIHSNAGGGHGCEAFNCKGASKKSRNIGEISERLFKNHFPNVRWRGLKQKNFTIIKRPKCPAILLELFFMDNEHECKTYLKTKEGRDRIAAYVIDIIVTFINENK